MTQGANSFTVGRRIAVYGPTGSGKTALARLLGERLGLPVVELDALFHKPNWQPTPTEEFREAVVAQLGRHAEGWVCDGNYGAVRDLVLNQADTVVWLRLPFRTVHWRLWRRTLRRLASQEPLWNGNRESWRKTFLSKESLLLWSVTSWRPHQRGISHALEEQGTRLQIVVLRSPSEIATFVASLPTLSGKERG